MQGPDVSALLGKVPRKVDVAAIVTRGDGVEAWHAASVAVVDASGRLTHAFGDPELVTLARSSIKPFQAIPVVTSGAADAFGLSSAELALACASHNGTDAHAALAQGMLEKIGANATDLGCGGHLPLGLRLAERPALAGEDRDPLRNNCSGKHAGFLALSRRLGVSFAHYLEPDGAVQTEVRRAVAAACRVPESELPRGVDGCSAPNYGLSLRALAQGMANLANPASAPEGLGPALERLRDAMLANPLLVSGEGRLDSDLMRSFPGRLVSKVGAEGLTLISLVEAGIGLAIKIHDGAERALAPICVAVLEELGLTGASTEPLLTRHARPVLRNHRKIITGEIIPTLKLTAR